MAIEIKNRSGDVIHTFAGESLRIANLSSADLRGADLSSANLSSATLSKGFEQSFEFKRTRILPDEGEIIGWKKCENGVIVKLLIPADAKRSHAFGRKCRAEFAEVLEIFDRILDGKPFARSQYAPEFVYRVGETVRSDNFYPDWREECAGGIHFFITRAEAEAY